MNGIPCHLSTRFPIENLERFETKLLKPVDWDNILVETQNSIKEESYEVETTLTSQRLAPEWLVSGNIPCIIAEGRGVLRDGSTKRYFLWTVFYHSWNIIKSSDESNITFEPVDLDFLGEDYEQDTYNAIADRLLDCTSVSFENKPTLQNPEAVLKMLTFFTEIIYGESINNEESAVEDAGRLRQEINKSENMANYWLKLILDTEDDEQKCGYIYSLIQAINNCWKIGQTYKFRIMREKRDS